MKKKCCCAASVMAVVLAASTTMTAFAKSSDDEFTYLITTSITGSCYDDYDDNPAVQYWLSHEWDADGDGEASPITVDFWAPPVGSEYDYVNNLISTGEYPDVMSIVYSSESALSLYEEEIALDLTDYIDQYMPNYKALIEANPDLHLSNVVDGEEKYIQIYNINDDEAPMPWGGFCYRRDWIVKYGTNPTTGEAFSGEWTDGLWSDDVVFPSGSTDPVTITDWEWMISIFQTALDDQGITDGYAVQLYYAGAISSGDLLSGFGGIGGALYYDEDGNIALGTTTDGFRAYLECMATWYANGWIDPAFAERANDLFFMVDAASVYSGKVGIWYGMSSQLMDSLDPKDGSSPYLDGAVVYAAASPVNDKYGDESVQNIAPTTYYADSLIGTPYIVTDYAAKKDLSALLTAIDWLYSDEGSMVGSRGLSKEILDANPDAPYTQSYLEWGLEDGAYHMDGDTIVVNPLVVADQDALGDAVSAARIAGKLRNNNVDRGYSDNLNDQLNVWKTYQNTGMIQSDLTSQLDSDAQSDYSAFMSNLYTVIAQWASQLINGQLDVTNDADWESFVNEVNALNPQPVIDSLQAIVDVLK